MHSVLIAARPAIQAFPQVGDGQLHRAMPEPPASCALLKAPKLKALLGRYKGEMEGN